jgi:hypothetical protein
MRDMNAFIANYFDLLSQYNSYIGIYDESEYPQGVEVLARNIYNKLGYELRSLDVDELMVFNEKMSYIENNIYLKEVSDKYLETYDSIGLYKQLASEFIFESLYEKLLKKRGTELVVKDSKGYEELRVEMIYFFEQFDTSLVKSFANVIQNKRAEIGKSSAKNSFIKEEICDELECMFSICNQDEDEIGKNSKFSASAIEDEQ